MTARLRLMRILISIFTLIYSFSVLAQTPSIPNQSTKASKADRTYTSVGVAMNEFRSVELVLDNSDTGSFVDVIRYTKAQPYALMATLGTYITDNFKTELRFGTGVHSDTIKESLEVNLKYWASWLIGPTYPITDYMSAYAMYGVSHYAADVVRHERAHVTRDQFEIPTVTNVIPSLTRMEEDLFGTSFSTSWTVGLDFSLTNELYLAFEYGRLLRDTETNIKVRQASTSLRYEF